MLSSRYFLRTVSSLFFSFSQFLLFSPQLYFRPSVVFHIVVRFSKIDPGRHSSKTGQEPLCSFPFPLYFLLRKEVIHPHVPVGIPCYDLTPVIGPAFDGSLLLLGYATGFGHYRLPWFDGRCVQGPGTYSPRHADPRLLAIPTSWRRVAASNPNWDGFYEIRSTSLSRCSL